MSKNRQVRLSLLVAPFVAGGLLLLSGGASGAPSQNKLSIASITSKAGADVWIQPSDAMIAQKCEYAIEFDAGNREHVDILDDLAKDWHLRGHHQTVAYQQIGQKPRAKHEYGSYEILLRNCCGLEKATTIGTLSFQFQKTNNTYNYTLYTGADDPRFAAKSRKKSWNLTAELDFAKGSSCR